MTISLLLVDDHPIIVSGLSAALAEDPNIEIVGTAGTLADARSEIAQFNPDVVLLDLRLPDGSGTELLAESQSEQGGPAFIVLSTFLTAQYVNAAIALGASGFLLKTSPVAEIVGAVVDVVGGVEVIAIAWRDGVEIGRYPVLPDEGPTAGEPQAA